VVESIEIPLAPNGVPFGPTYKPFIGTRRISETRLTNNGRDTVRFTSEGTEWFWNVELVKKAEPD